MNITSDESGWENLARAVRIQSQMKVELLDCETLLTKRKFQEALDSASGVTASLPSNSFETGGVRERAICVAVQALFELGRGEDAFSYATNVYAPCHGAQAPYAFIPPGVLKLLFKLRLHLDNGNPQQAQEILQPYISAITSPDASAHAATKHFSSTVDEETLELFLLDCVYPKEGRQAVEAFLTSTKDSLPPQAHAGLSAGTSAFFAELEAHAKAAAEDEEPPSLGKSVSDLDSKSRNPDDLAHAGDAREAKLESKPALPESPRKQQQQQAVKGGGGGGGGGGQPAHGAAAAAAAAEAGGAAAARAEAHAQLTPPHNPLSSAPPLSAQAAQAQARQRRLLWALGLGSAASWLLLAIVAARRGRLQMLRRLLQRWQRSVHVWGPLVGAFAFIFAFVVVVL